jgi:hypothetical protein
VHNHGLWDNRHRVGQLLERSKRIILPWLNYFGGNRRITWTRPLIRLQ